MTAIHQDNQQINITDLQQENQRLLLLQRIALIAAQNCDRSVLLHAALDELQMFFSVDGGGIYQLDRIDSPIYLTANFGIPEELVRELQKIPVGKGLTQQVLESGSPSSWIDLRCEPQLYCRAVLDEGWRSLLSLPLINFEQTVGVLFLFQRIQRQFSPQDIELLERVCQILANALATTKLLETLECQQKLTEAGQHELERSRMQLRAHLYRLEESNLTLEQTNRSKTRFLGVASHELRTPLTCILSATELLQLKLLDPSPEILELLNTLEQSGLRLQTLIEDLLELARIESRDLYLAREPLNLSQILTELHLEARIRANGRKITLKLGALPEQFTLLGDEHHLRRALGRLLDNALKFTPEDGQISIKTHHCKGVELKKKKQHLEKFCPDFFYTPLSDDYMLLQISDSGIGIDEEEQLRIFDTFYGATSLKHHGQKRESVRIHGAGLGLSLSKGIIEGHGGMIWVDSPADKKGSIFNVLLLLGPCRSGSGKET